MSRPGTLLLLTAGVVLGSHYVFPSPPETSGELAEITRISVAPDRNYRDVIPTFAPVATAFREAASGDGPAAALPVPKPSAWTTVVSAERSVVSPVRSARPPDPQTRTQLARDLQHELQRVGCYQGEVSGSWNLATRRAMAAFMDRANAVLPFNEPDYVLLALVQSHQDISCAADCPSGQTMQGGGRCVPVAIVAQAERQQQRLEVRRTAAARLAQERTQATVALSALQEPEVLPWQRRQVVANPLADVAIAPLPDPLPGRMSIGGPALPPETATLVPSDVAGPRRLPGAAAPRNSAKYAALEYEPDADNLSDDNGVAPADIDVAPGAAEPDVPAHKVKKPRHADRESRRQRRADAYTRSGKRRHGDPRPGSARYNLMQSLGGVY